MAAPSDPIEGPPRSGAALWEWGGILVLSGILVYLLSVSWRRWPDPLVDFGRELYLPWRLANGAVLYRDVDDFYGPLSQYLNAGLFRAFGPGLIVLVYANLAVFLAIVATLYCVLRRAWGIPAALASTAVFMAVFGLSQATVASNFNYATPYAHEATHGMLACLLLLAALTRWIERPTAALSFLAGLLFGAAAVLKPEFMFASAAVTGAALGLRAARRLPIGWDKALSWGAGALLPTLVFGLYFSRYFAWGHALALASRAWLNVVGSARFIGDPVQLKALGFDAPWPHLRDHVLHTAAAVAVVAGIAGASCLGGRIRSPWARPASWVIVLGASGWVAWSGTDWFEIGRCLLGLVLIYLVLEGRAYLRAERPSAAASREAIRLLTAVLAASLMARMLLYGRIYQFGFYQAALAALVVTAVLIGELPGRLRAGPNARLLAATAFSLVLAIGAGRLAWRSDAAFRLKTVEVGAGRDRFYAFPAKIAPSGELVESVTEALRQAGPGSSLIVLPEGEMINYLARMPSTVAPFFFFSAATEGGGEAEIVSQLNRHPPKYVVVISRSLKEYGLHYYGERYGQGRAIMEWVESRYQVVGTFGGNPIDPNQQGAVILSWGG